MTIRAVFFDVDFTLIYPGPTFQGEGYARFCAQEGVIVDPAAFEDEAVPRQSRARLDQIPPAAAGKPSGQRVHGGEPVIDQPDDRPQ